MEEQSFSSTEVLEINEEEEAYYDVESSLKQTIESERAVNSSRVITKASKANLEDGLKGAHGGGSGAALIKPSRPLEARRSSSTAALEASAGLYNAGAAHDAAPPLLPSQYPKCPEPFKWRKGSRRSCLSVSNTKWICNILDVDYPLAANVPIQLEVYSDGSLLSKRVLTLNKNRYGGQVTGLAWIRDALNLEQDIELLELVYLNRQTVVAHGPHKGQTVHQFQIKRVNDAVAETVIDSEESEMELSSDEEQEEEEGGGPSDATLQLKSARPIVVNVGIHSNRSGTTKLSPDITKWLAGVAKVPYPLEDSLCVQLEVYNGNELIGEKSVILTKNKNGGDLGGRSWLIKMLKLTEGDNGINLTYLGRKKVVHYFQGCHPQKRLAYRFKVEKATLNPSNTSRTSRQKRNRAADAPIKSAPCAVKRRRSNHLTSDDGKEARAYSHAASKRIAPIAGAQCDGMPAAKGRVVAGRTGGKSGTARKAAAEPEKVPNAANIVGPGPASTGTVVDNMPANVPSGVLASPAMPQMPMAPPAGPAAGNAVDAIIQQCMAAGYDERMAHIAAGIALGVRAFASAPASAAGAGGAAMPMPPPPGPQ